MPVKSPDFSGFPELVPTTSKQGAQQWFMDSKLLAEVSLDGISANSITDKPFDVSTYSVHSRHAYAPERENVIIRPVYRHGEHGPIGVPTGLVYVRMGNDHSLADCSQLIEQWGFRIHQPSGGAADELTDQGSGWDKGKVCAGWLEHWSGLCHSALASATDLLEIEGVTVVEPQFVMQRESKLIRPRR